MMNRFYTLLIVVVLVPVFVSGCGGQLSSDGIATFETALKTFETASTPEQYLASAKLYQSLIDQGVECGPVYYNQGNAYAQANAKGRALAAYRQAQKFMPANASLEADIVSVGGKPRVRSWLETLFFWQNWISYPAKAAALVVLSGVTVLIGLIPWFWFRKECVVAALIMLLITAVAGVSFAYDYYRFDCQRHGVVIAEEVVARKGDADSYSEAFDAPLQEGVEFLVVQQRGKWLKIKIDGDLEGWIPADTAGF